MHIHASSDQGSTQVFCRDMNRYLDTLGVTLDQFETFITDGLYEE